MQLTEQQFAFITAVVSGTGHKCLRARAGTGKTSTILEATAAAVATDPKVEILICAFGKAIQTEIDAKLKARGIDWKRAQAGTTHSIGWKLCREAFPDIKMDNNKVRDLIRQENGPAYQEFYSPISDLVHLGKLEGFGFFDDVQVGDVGAWYRMAEHYGVNAFDRTTDMDVVIECAQHIYRKSMELTEIADYDDMILFPLIKNIRVKWGKDYIFLDEAQDTSRTRRALVKKYLKRNGRLIIVGDDRQAIMAFAGASNNALDELISEMNAEVLPLTMTWRCPKKVVELAKTIVPDIEAAEGAIDGVVEYVTALPDELLPTDAILCRNTAPLIEQAYSLIRRGVPCKVEGREIGSGLLRIVDRWKRITTVTAFLDKLEDWQARETQKLIAKGKEEKVEELTDRCDTLRVICRAVQDKGRHDLDGVREFINSLFADNVTGVLTLCTYHRSKGREWQRVMLIEHSSRCPSPWARQDWELRQESNLAYVAITRTQHTLLFVN